MHGDFSRWTFEPLTGYRSVLLQQGRLLTDADWNEQGEITAHHDEVRTRDVVGGAGGPLTGAAFGLLDAAGAPHTGSTPWADLRLGAGRFYVAGILVEVPQSAGEPDGVGSALADQPFLRAIGAVPGLAEEMTNRRYAMVLDVWERQVTADEVPRLLESALGGPDTTTRSQTVWQVRLQSVDATDSCASLVGAPWLARTPPTMTASLAQSPPAADPCEISTSAGYRRLENQLYRVQVYQVNEATGQAHYVWSRENGSVVAGLLRSSLPPGPGADRVLHLDREGRDEELSFRAGDIVEVTSRDRELAGIPGLLATAGAPDGLTLPVTWIDGAGADPATDMDRLGSTPIVRRWEGGPAAATASVADLEDGIQVAFGDGDFRVGDYWLIPARTVRLVYGVTALAGTIEWPTDPPAAAGDPPTPRPMPPAGAEPSRAVLGVLERTSADADSDGTWELVWDCRRLTPSLTELVTLDLLGGDGQESLPGEPLPEPIRVAVRNGGVAVEGASVRFEAADGHLIDDHLSETAVPDTADPASVDAITDASGHAEVRWLLGRGTPETHVMTAVRLDDADQPAGAQVRVTGRASVASQVGWDPVCRGFADSTTVQAALGQLATTQDLRLLGGDGQQVLETDATVPHEIRVVLDSPCGPVADQPVRAEATDGALVDRAPDGSTNPGTLTGSGASSVAEAETDADGVAAFWWQPNLGRRLSDVLRVFADGAPAAPIQVTAHRALIGDGDSSRTPGMHIDAVRFRRGSGDFENDTDVGAGSLAEGIEVDLDREFESAAVTGKPVVRVVLDLPWPIEGEADVWTPDGEGPVGLRHVEIQCDVTADSPQFYWNPTTRAQEWLTGVLPDVAGSFDIPIVGRFIIDGWAIVEKADDETSMNLNCHVRTVYDSGDGRVAFLLPTDDEVTGGQFVQWFRLVW